MAIYFDNGKYELKIAEGQMILSERVPNKSRETGEIAFVSRNYKFFTQPEWLMLHLLRKEICKGDVGSIKDLLGVIRAAETRVVEMGKEIRNALSALEKSKADGASEDRARDGVLGA